MTSRIVILSGANAGIGLATTAALAARGDIVVAGVRDRSRSDDLDAVASTHPGRVEIVDLDVTDTSQVDDTVAAALHRHGRVDALVANAGVGSNATLEELSLDELHACMDVNFTGVMRLTKALLPPMRSAGAGRLVAVTSVAGAVGQPFNDAYCAAKHAVEGAYESLRPVMARMGVHVSIVQPGPVATAFATKGVRAAAATDSSPYDPLRRRYEAMMAAGADRLQSPEDAAAVIVDVLDAPAPMLRYQTSRFTGILVGRKLADLDGERVMALTNPWLD